VKLRDYLKFEKNADDKVRSQNECMGDLSMIFLLVRGEN
jgi:hypothetical protein